MRPYSLLVRLHRYVGLTIAFFLVVAGLTGSIIAFHGELDAWLNPELFHVKEGRHLPPTALAERVEASDARIRVAFVEVDVKPGRSAVLWVEPRPGTTDVGYNQVFADPSTGVVLGQRSYGSCCLQRQAIIPFLYNLHRRLTMPGHWGDWLMGGVAVLWLLDCFVALVLAAPRHIFALSGWQSVLRIRWQASPYRVTFDLHRAGGLWPWIALAVLALTSISLNLDDEVVRPVVGLFSTLAPSPYDQASAGPGVAAAKLSFDDILALCGKLPEMTSRGYSATGIYLDRQAGIYVADFASESEFMFGFAWAAFDATSGHLIGTQIPGIGRTGDIFLQLQFPLHSGRIGGLAGRIVISLLGVAIAMLSITGVIIWLKKHRVRRRQREMYGGAQRSTG